MASTTTNGKPSANGKPPPASGKAKRAIARNPTRAYRGGGGWLGWNTAALDNAPVFTWYDIPRMLRDPRVRFIEQLWPAPFQKVKWEVVASDERVKNYVDATLRKFWQNSLPNLLLKYWRYGYAPGGAEFVARNGLWHLDQVRAIEPRDASPRVWADGPDAGRFAGFTFSNSGGGGAPIAGSGGGWVGPPHAFWFAGRGEHGELYDAPPMAGLFEPWAEKRTRGGAIQSRRLYHRKYGFQGGTLRHPDGRTEATEEDPQGRDYQDIARETLDYMEAGDTLTLANDKHPAMDGEYAWEYTPATAPPDVPSIREYPKDLDAEMLEGTGIPPEVFEAADTGSGWSGRLIPLLGYLGSVDFRAGLVVRSAEPWLRPAVRVNYGPRAWYEVRLKSLADEVAQQSGKGGPNPVPDLFSGKPPDATPPGKPPAGAPLTLSTTIPDVAPPKRYGCVYVALPQDLADRVRALGRRIPEADLAEKGRELEPHATARWGLETSDVGAVREIVSEAAPPRVKIGGASFFPAAETGKNYDAVKLDVASPDLRRLNRELASLPHHDERASYVPHVTVAYVKAGRGAEWAERLGRLDAEFAAAEAVFSDRDRNATPIAFAGGAKELSAAPVPAPVRAPALELSDGARHAPAGGIDIAGTHYTGGQFVPAEALAKASPAERARLDEGAEPERVFARPDFAHIPDKPDGGDLGAVRAESHAEAEAAGLDPAELHRRVADSLETQLRAVATQRPEHWSAGRHAAHHDAQAEVHRILGKGEADRAAGLRGHAADFRNTEAERRASGGSNADHFARLAKQYEDKAAEHAAAAASHAAREGEHATAAAKARRGEAPAPAPIGRAALLRATYAEEHEEMAQEAETKRDAAKFSAKYFGQENPLRRAAGYLKKLGTDGDTSFAGHLDADTRAAVAEDLAQLPPAKLAAHVAYAADQAGHTDPKYAGTPEAAAWEIAKAAALAAPAATGGAKFDGSSPGDFSIVHRDDVNDDHWAGLSAAARLAPGAKVPVDRERAIVVAAGTPLAKIADDMGFGQALDDETGLQGLFSALKSGNLLPQEHVPESAKDYGGTSGSKGSGEYQPEESWSPAKVPVYRRVNEDWFVRARPANETEDVPPYELVQKKDVPPLSRLPEVYWKDFDPGNSDTDDDLVAERESREEKRSPEGTKQKKDIGEWKKGVKEWQGEVGKMKTQWQQALAGVPEDERPDEPDWDAVDDSALTATHDSREDHASALESLQDEYADHVAGLREAIEEAKAHAAEWHAENTERRPKIRALLDRHAAAEATAQADEDLSGEADGLVGEYGLDAYEDAPKNVRGSVRALNSALAAVEGDTPDHDGSPIDPDDYEDGGSADHLAELEENVPAHEEAVSERSAEWRAGLREKLDAVRATAEKALALPEEHFAPGDRELIQKDLGRAKELLAKLDTPAEGAAKELSATPDPTAERAAAGAIGGRLMRQRKAVLAQLVALAMIRRQEDATAGGSPEAAASDLQKLAALANDPAAVARVVGMRGMDGAGNYEPRSAEPLSLSWEAYTGPRGGKGWKDSESGRVVYQNDRPGKHAERKASAVAAREILGRIHGGTGITADDLAELPKHIPLLTKEQLSNARILLEAKWGMRPGVRARRDDMVKALLTHVAGLAKGPATGLPGLAGNAAREEAAKRAEKPKAVPKAPTRRGKVDSVLQAAVDQGGIDPNSHDLKRHYTGLNHAKEDGIPLAVFRKGGMGLDTLAEQLARSGDINVPGGRDPGEHLLELLRKKALTAAADRSADAEKNEAERAKAAQADAEAARAEFAAGPTGEGGEGGDAAPPPDAYAGLPTGQKTLKRGVDESEGLSEAQRSAYHAAVDRVAAVLPKSAHDRLAKHLYRATFHATGGTILDGLKLEAQSDFGIEPADEKRILDAVEAWKAKGVNPGGLYTPALRSVHLDGDSSARLSGRYAADATAPQIYAHEIGHAIDGPDHELSRSDAWGKAFDAEIGPNAGSGPEHRLTQYAATRPEEGFAEFSRLLYTPDVGTAQIAADFPAASAFFKERGLWPRERKGAKTQAREVFAGKVDTPGGGHMDMVKSAGEFVPEPTEKGERRRAKREAAAEGRSPAVAPADAAVSADEITAKRKARQSAASVSEHAAPTEAEFAAASAKPANGGPTRERRAIAETPLSEYVAGITGAENINAARAAHRMAVLTATKNGATLPPEVLADYPEVGGGSAAPNTPGVTIAGYAKKPPAPAPTAPKNAAGLSESARKVLAVRGLDPDSLGTGEVAELRGKIPMDVFAEIARHEMSQRFARQDTHGEWANRSEESSPAPTDRGSLDSIRAATDRALGVARPEAAAVPAKGAYAAWLRAADPATVRALAPSPLLDRGELLAAVAEVYGPAVHAEARRKSKQGIAELLAGAKPAESLPTTIDKPTSVGNNAPVPPAGGGSTGGAKMDHVANANAALAAPGANPASLSVADVEPDGVWVSGIPGAAKQFLDWKRLDKVIGGGLMKKDIVASLRAVRDSTSGARPFSAAAPEPPATAAPATAAPATETSSEPSEPQHVGRHSDSGLAFAVDGDTVHVTGNTRRHAAALRAAGFQFIEPPEEAADAPKAPGHRPPEPHWAGTLEDAVNLQVPGGHNIQHILGVKTKQRVGGRRVVTGRK